MKNIIIVAMTMLAVTLVAVAIYIYVLGGALPIDITLPGQPDFAREIDRGEIQDTREASLAAAITDMFVTPIVIKDGEITSMGDVMPLLSAASGLYTFAPSFPAKDYVITGFDCGRPMTLFFEYDRNYYCVVRPSTDIVYQLIDKKPPYSRIVGPEDGTMTAELLLAQDAYGYHFGFVNKDRVNDDKSAVIVRESFIKIMTSLYNETSSELAVSKNLFEAITSSLCFKELIHLDYGFTVNADIRAYYPHDKRIILSPDGGLCITDITVSKKTTVSKNLLKRVGPIGADSYYLAYRQPLSGNVVIALPDGESYLYISISGAGEIQDNDLFEYMLNIVTVDYAGSLALIGH